MLKKRLVGVVTVRDCLAVQSFGFKSYLPLGRPEVLIENFDRWGADEILVQVIDRSINFSGPAFELIDRISKIGISTPIIYAGGIRHELDAIDVIKRGADRVALNNMLITNASLIHKVVNNLGSQAVIGSLPLTSINGSIKHYNYVERKSINLSREIKSLIAGSMISEFLVTDWENEGSLDGFNVDFANLSEFKNANLILFGGLGSVDIGRKVIGNVNVSAIAVGNSFSYKEHAIQDYKSQLNSDLIRRPYFRDERNYD
jgi:imidazole glycerol-phosphate synthase subunit HisF